MGGLDIVDAGASMVLDRHPRGHATTGGVRVREGSPRSFPLWLVVLELDDGGELRWADVHGDEAVYVRNGALEVADGRRCPTRGAVVVEADAVTSVRAVGPTTVVHVGPHDPAPPTDGINGPAEPGGRQVHVVGPGGTWAVEAPDRDTHYYGDSTCPSCRLTLLYTSRNSTYTSEAHSHSQDELIHVLDGSIRLGNRVIGPGTTLAIAADQRYGFVSDNGFAFINYRRDASTMTTDRTQPPRTEGGEANGLTPVMDLV